MGTTSAALSSANPDNKESDSTDLRSSLERLKDAKTEQLFIALVGPVGTDISKITRILSEVLRNDFNYTCIEKSLSAIIRENHQGPIKNTFIKGEDSEEFKRVTELILRGNALRSTFSKSVLADFVVRDIGLERTERKEKGDRSDRICYIIKSIKNIAEYDVLKNVYGELLYFFGVFSPHDTRKFNLTDTGTNKMSEVEAETVMRIDAKQHEIDYGQNVVDTFSKADFFLRVDSASNKDIENKISRFLNLIFDTELITPTINETAMYQAASAASNSACLSRQVGAAITDKDGNLISVGWNDVPKYGGDLYIQSSNDPANKIDSRCYNIGSGVCYNDTYKNDISEKLLKKLVKAGLISEEKERDAYNIIRNSNLKDLIEFSRSIHAEMHAIISGSQKTGYRMRGGKLFCTTYPCHNCARHIIAAGIEEVYFIEPYEKSLGIKLHSDALTDNEKATDKVRILMYDGVSPNRYLSLFKLNVADRKFRDGSGQMNKIEKRTAKPKETRSLEAISTLESSVAKSLESKLQKIGKTINLNV